MNYRRFRYSRELLIAFALAAVSAVVVFDPITKSDTRATADFQYLFKIDESQSQLPQIAVPILSELQQNRSASQAITAYIILDPRVTQTRFNIDINGNTLTYDPTKTTRNCSLMPPYCAVEIPFADLLAANEITFKPSLFDILADQTYSGIDLHLDNAN